MAMAKPLVRAFAHDDSHPTTILNNTASTDGGGIYLAGQADACLFAPRVANNVAEDGAAVFYTLYPPGSDAGASGSGIYINGGSPDRLGADCGPELVSDLGGTKDCRPYDTQCNAFDVNVTQHADGSPSAGSVITLNSGDLVAARFRVRGSVAATVIYQNFTISSTVVSRCEVTNNSVSVALILTPFTSGPTSYRGCTIANNSIGGPYVFNFNNSTKIDFAYNLISQPGKHPLFVYQPNGGTFTAGYIMSNDITGLPADNPSIIVGTPYFVDATNGDYHLAPNGQIALDFAPCGTDASTDLDGEPGCTNLPGLSNLYGPRDLGAYERQNLFYNCGAADSVFCSGFDH
jgi:predicted outer membrane repeat protein